MSGHRQIAVPETLFTTPSPLETSTAERYIARMVFHYLYLPVDRFCMP